MYNTFSNLDWRILVAICFLTSGLIAVFLFFSSNSGSPPVKSTPSVSPTNRQNITPIPTPAWQVYTEADYSISYPPDITVTPQNLVGGKAIRFNLPQGSDYFMNLEIIPNLSVEDSLQIFRSGYKYQEDDISIDGNTAKKFIGSINLEGKQLQEIITIIEHNNQIYKLELTYPSSERMVAIDQIFYKIFSSLRFSKAQ